MNISKVDPSYKLSILNILTKYFKLIESNDVEYILPNNNYKWLYYDESKRTLIYITELLKQIDDYWEYTGNLDWAQREHGTINNLTFLKGPGLSRLPDDAKLALWQELDTIYSEYYNSIINKPNDEYV